MEQMWKVLGGRLQRRKLTNKRRDTGSPQGCLDVSVTLLHGGLDLNASSNKKALNADLDPAVYLSADHIGNKNFYFLFSFL
jgi:hypothetical protein